MTQRPIPNLNRAQRGEGMGNRLRGAMNKAETGYRNASGGGRITSLFVSVFPLYL